MRVLFPSVLLFLVACSTVSSSIQYTDGTKALERGDYERAVTLFEDAVRLDPGTSRNHNNLAAALFELNRLGEGWPYVRQAVNLDPRNEYAVQNCKRYVVAMLKQANLDIGSSRQEVTRVLGAPDNQHQGGDCVWFDYGVSGLCFKSDRLDSFADFSNQ